jgi:hypothetical protein
LVSDELINPIAVTAIQAMVAPVVLITTAAILSVPPLAGQGSDHRRVELTPLSPTALNADNRAGASTWPCEGW